MNLREAYSGIYKNETRSPNNNSFLSKEMLFKGTIEKKKTQIIKNQQMNDYHMYRNKQPWEINKNAGEMFNGHNQQRSDNEYLTSEYQNQGDLTPMYYDAKTYGNFDTHVTLPNPLTNPNGSDKFYEYHTNIDGQGLPIVYDVRTEESKNPSRQRRSIKSENEYDDQNHSLQSHFFTPMSGIALQHNTNDESHLRPHMTRDTDFQTKRQQQQNRNY